MKVTSSRILLLIVLLSALAFVIIGCADDVTVSVSSSEGIVETITDLGSTKADGSFATAQNAGSELPDTNEATLLEIPAGVIMTDAAGDPVTGEITATVTYYSNQSVESLEEYPGGLMGIPVTQADGSRVQGSFVSGGFSAIDMSNEDGDEVKNFGGAGVTVTITLPAATINPETGVAVTTGDVIPVWSYDTATLDWVFQANGTVGALAGDVYPVEFTTTHLTYFNLDWFDAGCEMAFLNIISEDGLIPALRPEIIGSGFYKIKSYAAAGEAEHSFANAPEMPLTINVYQSVDGSDVLAGTTTTSNWCAETNQTVTIGLEGFTGSGGGGGN